MRHSNRIFPRESRIPLNPVRFPGHVAAIPKVMPWNDPSQIDIKAPTSEPPGRTLNLMILLLFLPLVDTIWMRCQQCLSTMDSYPCISVHRDLE